MRRNVGRWLLTCAIGTWSNPSFAFCRTTTCDRSVPCSDDPELCCIYDDQLCDINGAPVSWPTSCVSYNTQEDGSPLRHITAHQLAEVLDRAYLEWLSVTCDGEPLSLAVDYRGDASCHVFEFNKEDDPTNANVWMFQDDPEKTNSLSPSGGGIDASSIAVSNITYHYEKAEIVDVDVEFNSASAAFTVGEKHVEFDLQSVATHEAGHFLGLDHSVELGVTMQPRYSPMNIAPRTLSDDDKAGICAIYPPDRVIPEEYRTCEPYGEYSPDCYEDPGCGCKTAGGARGPNRGFVWALAWLGLGLGFVRRRSALRNLR